MEEYWFIRFSGKSKFMEYIIHLNLFTLKVKTERSQVLEGLKPFDKMIKEIIEAAEYFNDTIHRNDWLHIQYPIQDWLVAYHHPPSDILIIRL